MKFTACFLLFVLAVSADALTDEQKAKINTVSKECQAKSGISDEALSKLRTGQYTNDAKTDAQILCFVQGTGVINEAGQVQPDVLRARLSGVVSDQEKVNSLVTSCGIQGDNPTETAKAIALCLKAAKAASGHDISLY